MLVLFDSQPLSDQGLRAAWPPRRVASIRKENYFNTRRGLQVPHILTIFIHISYLVSSFSPPLNQGLPFSELWLSSRLFGSLLFDLNYPPSSFLTSFFLITPFLQPHGDLWDPDPLVSFWSLDPFLLVPTYPTHCLSTV